MNIYGDLARTVLVRSDDTFERPWGRPWCPKSCNPMDHARRIKKHNINTGMQCRLRSHDESNPGLALAHV